MHLAGSEADEGCGKAPLELQLVRVHWVFLKRLYKDEVEASGIFLPCIISAILLLVVVP